MADENDIWTVGRILAWIEGYLRDNGDENPRLSAQWLVAEALGVSRIQLYADLQRPLSQDERGMLRGYTRRRALGEPLQYITGTTDFRFITVKVRPGVLIPRPETEVLVSEALAELAPQLKNMRAAREEARLAALAQAMAAQAEAAGAEVSSADPEDAQVHAAHGENAPSEPAAPAVLRIVDACTGTGCIACALAREVPEAQICATDISAQAVALACENAGDLDVADRVQVLAGDLLAPVPHEWRGAVDLIISNPPYIPTAELAGLDAEVTAFEPTLALDGGADGLDLFRRLVGQARDLLAPGGTLAVELHETCLDEAADLARAEGFNAVRIAQDLAGRPRVLIAKKPL